MNMSPDWKKNCASGELKKEANKKMAIETSETNIQEDNKGSPSGIRWGRLLAWVGLLGLLSVIALGMVNNKQGPVLKGQQVKNFSFTTFEGNKINLEDLKGKVVLINFWASWCNPCKQEAADLESAWQFYKDRGDVVFLGVDYVDTEPEAKAYLKEFNITYPNGPDLGTRISQMFRITGVPETYVLDRDGRLQAIKISPFNSLVEIKGMIDPLLGE